MNETGGVDRGAMAVAMRAFRYQQLDLSLLPSEEGMPGKKRDPKYSAFIKAKGSARASGALTAMGWAVLMFGRFPRRSEPIPFFVENFWYMFGVLFFLSAWAFHRGRVASSLQFDRWSELLRINGLFDVASGIRFAGDTVNRGGVVQGVCLPGDARRVSFGTYNGWFDPDYPQTGDYAQTDTSLYYQLFVHVELPELSFAPIYITPHRPADFETLPKMSEAAKAGIRDLSSRYAVVIGGDSITVTLAGNTTNSYSASMLASIDHASRWALCIGIINKQLSAVVEGLNT